MFISKIGIDLGTTNILVYLPNKGIVIQEPSVVAVESSGKKIMAIGKEAHNMLGRTPDSVTAVHPLLNGAIANFRVTEAMLKYYINQVSGRIRFTKPDIMISVPAGITSTEKRAVVDATINAGAKNAYLIKEPIAAALGADIKISTPSGHMIIDIGGGTTEVAVISLSDIVVSSSARIAGNQIDQAIVSYVRKKNKLIIGKQTAENIKIKIGSCLPLDKDLSMEVSGSNSISGLPESQILKTTDIIEPIKSVLNDIISTIKNVLQKTPPELASDIMDKGIVITGGSAHLRDIDKLFTKIIGVPCQIADNPETCVVKGTGIAIEHLSEYKRSLLWGK